MRESTSMSGRGSREPEPVPAPAPAALPDVDYPAFCRSVLRVTGVDLTQYRREQTERRVRAMAVRRGADSLLAYLVLLRRSEHERALFRDRVTINVSQLWRNPAHWEFIAREVVPELARRRTAVTAWSAGCSYGAEPYTLAMIWAEAAGARPIRILGTDIDVASIERARAGCFSDEDVRDVPEAMRARWLEQVEPGRWRVHRRLRSLVCFEQADLFGDPPSDRHDLVVCRNVVIYLTPERRDELHRTLVEALRPGGFLMVGATERVARAAELGLESVHPFIYRRIDGAAT